MMGPFGAPAAVVDRALERGAARVTDINERTRDAVRSFIADGLSQGLSPAELADRIEAGVRLDNGQPAFDELRAETIARTELADAYNGAALASYSDLGITMVEAIDGDEDEECVARQERNPYTIDEADAEEDHPNGTLDWVPVIEDIVPPEEVAGAAVETVSPEEMSPLDQAVADFERGIIEKAPSVEFGQVFDAEGNALTGIVKGGKGSVKFNIHPNQLRGSTVTHFHPPAEGRVTGEHFISLSREDVISALDRQEGAIRAFAIDGRWMELRNTGYQYNGTGFRVAFDNAWKDAQRGQWWAQAVRADEYGSAAEVQVAYEQASDAWNAAYKQTLLDVIERIGTRAGGTLQIVEGGG